MSLLEDFMVRKYGVRTQSIVNPVVSPGVVGTSPIMVLRRNSNRIGYTIMNLSGGSMYAGIDGNVSASCGLLLDALGGSITSWIEEDGEHTQKEVWVVGAEANRNVYVMETIGQ